MVNASYGDYTSGSYWTIHIYSAECETILATTPICRLSSTPDLVRQCRDYGGSSVRDRASERARM